MRAVHLMVTILDSTSRITVKDSHLRERERERGYTHSLQVCS